MQKPVFVVMLLAIGSLLTLAGFMGAQILNPPANPVNAVDPDQLAKIDSRLKILENKMAAGKTLYQTSLVGTPADAPEASQSNPLADLLNTLPRDLWPVVTVYKDPNTKARADWVTANVISKTLTLTGTVKSVGSGPHSDHPEVRILLELPVTDIWSDTPRFTTFAAFPDMAPYYFSGKKTITFTGKIEYLELAPFTGNTPSLSLTDCRIVTKLSADSSSASTSPTGNSPPLPQ